MVNMKENYLKSLQMIKMLDIKTEEEYKKLLKNYLLLSTVSLKYISQTDDFNKIIVQAKEVEQTSFSEKYYIAGKKGLQ